MNSKDLKYVVGEVSNGKPCDIRFFNDVNDYTAHEFVNEFLWIENNIKPSKIRVHINSCGGSVIAGMSVFSVISNSTIPTECINVGLAASMGSIIWAAGDKSLMCDYAILMIHNPFIKAEDDGKKTEDESVKVFRQQLETIYMKRWGLSKTKVKEIMDGEEGCDGTFFTAEQVVESGIIPATNIIKTNKQKVERVKNAIDGVKDKKQLQDTIASICCELSLDELKNGIGKPSDDIDANLNKNTEFTNLTKNEKMEDKTIEFNFGAVVASLGFKEKAEVSQVMARINELIGIEAKLKEANDTIDALKIENAGEVSKNNNLKQELDNVKAELQVYKNAERESLIKSIESMVDGAIEAGKIETSTKEQWVEMAQKNLELVKATLDSIPAREQISKEINNDEKNLENVKNELENLEDKVQKAIKEVIGNNFAFKSID